MGLLALSILGVALLVFTGLFLIFKKYSSIKNPLSSFYYWITAIVLIPSLYIGLILLYLVVSSSYEKKEFDKDNWANNRDSRYVYTEDLIQGKKLIGLTSYELKDMLNEADHEDDSTLVFYIGYSPDYFLNMDPDYLVTDLTNGKVSKVYIRE